MNFYNFFFFNHLYNFWIYFGSFIYSIGGLLEDKKKMNVSKDKR